MKLGEVIQNTTITVIALALSLAACGGPSGGGPALDGPPSVFGMDQSSLKVGQTLHFMGNNFLNEEDGYMKVRFEGVYYARDENGNETPRWTDFTVRTVYDGIFPEGGSVNEVAVPAGTQLIRWNRFGPFDVPFSEDKLPGTFEGKVRAIAVYKDGTEVEDPEPPTLALEVAPSISINMLEPVIDFTEDGQVITANCGDPALRVFGGMAYIMEVEAVGFRPVEFRYRISSTNGNTNSWTEWSHAAQGSKDRLGDPAIDPDEIFFFEELGLDQRQAVSVVAVSATDAAGQEYFTALPIRIVRPLEVFHDGQRHLAEYYEPEVVNGPIIGAIFSSLSYTEQHSESRQRGVAVTVSETMNNGVTETLSEGVSVTDLNSTSVAQTTGESYTETDAETYGTSYTNSTANTSSTTTTNGTQWSNTVSTTNTREEYNESSNETWNTTKFGGNFGLGGGGTIAENIPILGSVATKWGIDIGFTRTKKSGSKEGIRESTTETQGETYTESSSFAETFGSTTTEAETESFSGTYSIASQNSINNTTSEVQSSSESVTYQMGNTESVVYGESEAYNDSFITTEGSAALLSFSSSVPRDACAVIYRQTVRWMRSAQLYSHDACGVKTMVAEMNFADWTWSPNIALAESCDEGLAPSTLPEAECFLGCD